jgi:molybdopterin-containing oxidoreductase family iron-sulfur binding subunit
VVLAEREVSVAAPAPTVTLKKRRYGMLIDLRRCVGCETCTVACKAENNIGVDSSWIRSRRITWNQVIFEEETNPEPDVKFMPQPCNHCDYPPCVKVCPVGATYKDEETGIVMQNYDRCIGCRYCTVACPYTRRYFNWEAPSFPHNTRTGAVAFSAVSGGFNPLVPVRKKGITEKCVFCIQRVRAAEEQARAEGRELRDGDIQPACVTTCIAQARIFGDLNDLESRISKLLAEHGDRVVRLEEHLGTGPNVYYIPED